MINRKTSVHLQDFPDVNFIESAPQLVARMDFVRLICSTALSIRDHKNLRVRLPLNKLVVIGKNSAQILDFKDIIADEVNVKNIEIQEDLEKFADILLKINFKKIGAKYGAKIKEITAAAKNSDFEKIAENEIKIAGVNLVDDEFELKLAPKTNVGEGLEIVALPDNSCLVCLDVKITDELSEEGIARDIVRGVQQARKDADLDVSDRIDLRIFCADEKILTVVKKFESYIKEQVLAKGLQGFADEDKARNGAKFFAKNKIEDGEIGVGIL